MSNPCGKYAPDNSNSPVGKGEKTKKKVKEVFGKQGTSKRIIMGK